MNIVEVDADPKASVKRNFKKDETLVSSSCEKKLPKLENGRVSKHNNEECIGNSKTVSFGN